MYVGHGGSRLNFQHLSGGSRRISNSVSLSTTPLSTMYSVPGSAWATRISVSNNKNKTEMKKKKRKK